MNDRFTKRDELADRLAGFCDEPFTVDLNTATLAWDDIRKLLALAELDSSPDKESEVSAR